MADYVTKAELESALEATKVELLERIEERIEDTRIRLLERIEKSETNLLTAFQVWARRIERGIRVQAIDNESFRGRLEALEDKVFGTTTKGIES